MKIRELKTYQSVKFQQKQESFFTASEQLGMKDLEMEVVSWGILVRTGKDEAIISFNNVAYAKPLREEAPAAKKTAKA
jgi:hypothetical protein